MEMHCILYRDVIYCRSQSLSVIVIVISAIFIVIAYSGSLHVLCLNDRKRMCGLERVCSSSSSSVAATAMAHNAYADTNTNIDANANGQASTRRSFGPKSIVFGNNARQLSAQKTVCSRRMLKNRVVSLVISLYLPNIVWEFFSHI